MLHHHHHEYDLLFLQQEHRQLPSSPTSLLETTAFLQPGQAQPKLPTFPTSLQTDIIMEDNLKPQHKRGPWSQSEDKELKELMSQHADLNWVRISNELQSRTAKQCRERFYQNLKPNLNHSPITPEEGAQIEALVREKGKRWAEIARLLNNRSDNAVKNWWNGSQNRRKREEARRRSQAAGENEEGGSTGYNHQHQSRHANDPMFVAQRSHLPPPPGYDPNHHHHHPLHHPHQHHHHHRLPSPPPLPHHRPPFTPRHSLVSIMDNRPASRGPRACDFPPPPPAYLPHEPPFPRPPPAETFNFNAPIDPHSSARPWSSHHHSDHHSEQRQQQPSPVEPQERPQRPRLPLIMTRKLPPLPPHPRRDSLRANLYYDEHPYANAYHHHHHYTQDQQLPGGSGGPMSPVPSLMSDHGSVFSPSPRGPPNHDLAAMAAAAEQRSSEQQQPRSRTMSSATVLFPDGAGDDDKTSMTGSERTAVHVRNPSSAGFRSPSMMTSPTGSLVLPRIVVPPSSRGVLDRPLLPPPLPLSADEQSRVRRAMSIHNTLTIRPAPRDENNQ